MLFPQLDRHGQVHCLNLHNRPSRCFLAMHWTPPPPSQPMYPFPPAPPRIPMAPPLHGPITPQRCTTTTLKSPPTASPPTGTSPIRHGYTCRVCEIPPVDSWKPDVDFHDTNKVNGFDFPASNCQHSIQQILGLQGHRGYGSTTSTTLEVFAPGSSKHLASSHCVWSRNLRASF